MQSYGESLLCLMATKLINYLSRITFKSLLKFPICWPWLEGIKYLCGKEAHKWLIQDLERLGYKYIPEFSSDTGNVYVHMRKIPHLQGADEIGQNSKKILLDDFIFIPNVALNSLKIVVQSLLITTYNCPHPNPVWMLFVGWL